MPQKSRKKIEETKTESVIFKSIRIFFNWKFTLF